MHVIWISQHKSSLQILQNRAWPVLNSKFSHLSPILTMNWYKFTVPVYLSRSIFREKLHTCNLPVGISSRNKSIWVSRIFLQSNFLSPYGIYTSVFILSELLIHLINFLIFIFLFPRNFSWLMDRAHEILRFTFASGQDKNSARLEKVSRQHVRIATLKKTIII